MKVSDPFGRSARRRDAQYARFEQTLRQAQVVTDREVDRFVARVQRNMMWFATMLGALMLLDLLLLPNTPPLITLCAVVALIWLLATLLRTREFVRRYRERSASATPTS